MWCWLRSRAEAGAKCLPWGARSPPEMSLRPRGVLSYDPQVLRTSLLHASKCVAGSGLHTCVEPIEPRHGIQVGGMFAAL